MSAASSPVHPEFRVRVAALDDLPALISLRRSMYEAMFVPVEALDDSVWQAAFAQWVNERLDDPATRIVVAETHTGTHDGTMGAQAHQQPDQLVAACAIGEVTSLIPGPQFPSGRVGLLSNVSTLAGYRGFGMGAACTDAVLDWFKNVGGVERIDLFATAEGEPIYLKRGFERRRFPAMVRHERTPPTP